MKKTLLITVFLIGSLAIAQPSGKLRERIKSQKIAFITEKLNLTSEEAQQFWHIYNTIDNKKEALRKQSALKRNEKNPNQLNEEEATLLLKEMLSIEDKKHQLNKQLVLDLSDVISSKKIVSLMRAEREFDKKLLQRLKEFRAHRKTKN